MKDQRIAFWKREEDKLLVVYESGRISEFFGPDDFLFRMAHLTQEAMINQAMDDNYQELVDDLVNGLRELRDEYRFKSRD